MTRRLAFLFGNLTGIAAGGLLVFAYFSNQSAFGTIAPPATLPSRFIVPANFSKDPVPADWERFEFNGREYYFVPLKEPRC